MIFTKKKLFFIFLEILTTQSKAHFSSFSSKFQILRTDTDMGQAKLVFLIGLL